MFSTFQIIGHRGWPAKYPENTLLGFEKAISAGATMIEFDIQLTRYNKLVVFHDDTAKRLCNRHIEMCNASEEAIDDLKIDGQPIPYLPEVFDKFGDSVNYYIELKTFDKSNIEYKRKLAFYTINEIVRNDLRANCLIASFDLTCLKIAKQLGYNNLGVCHSDKKQPIPAKVSCKPHKSIKDVDKFTYAWTVNNKRRMKTLIKQNVHGIVTDHPDRLSEVCETMPSYAA